MKSQLSKCLQVSVLIMLIASGCKKHTEPIKQTEKCRLISYVTNGFPMYWIYDNKKELINGEYFTRGNIEMTYIHDHQGCLLKVVNVGKHIFEGDTLLSEYTYDDNRLRTLKYYGREYDINWSRSYKSTLTCTLYYSNKSDLPDSMHTTKSRIDSIGREYIQEPIRLDRFLFDNRKNLTKQETYIVDIDGTPSLVASNHHTYDSKPNYLKEFKQINFVIDQSIPYIFSNNNLLHTRREVPGKQPIEISFKIAYDGDMVIDDGMGSSEMEWSCE